MDPKQTLDPRDRLWKRLIFGMLLGLPPWGVIMVPFGTDYQLIAVAVQLVGVIVVGSCAVSAARLRSRMNREDRG